MEQNDLRLIEAGFPCHQVGAETQRERGASSALPPLYYLHVWWARRPLTPSRAAILASLLPADADPEAFVKELGIRVLVADVQGVDWVLDDERLINRLKDNGEGYFSLTIDALVIDRHNKESDRRAAHRNLQRDLLAKHPTLANDSIFRRWESECIDLPPLDIEKSLVVKERSGDPAWAKERIAFEGQFKIRTQEDKYKYQRAYTHQIQPRSGEITVLPSSTVRDVTPCFP
jgi:hypothetical protein